MAGWDRDDVESLIITIQEISTALKRLGLNEADTNMGATEALGAEIREGFQLVGRGLADISDALREIKREL